MKHKLSTRVLSMLMAIIMMLSLTTSVFAADPPASAEPEVIVEKAAQNSPAPSASPAPGDDPSRLSTVYEGHRIHYIDSKKQPLPKNAELFMNEINEDDVPFYLQRAAHSLGLESCGMYLYFIADPLLEDASTAEILKYQANPDDPEDRMTVEVTLIDDSKMTDEEKELRLEELQNIHLEDLRVIQLGAYWDYDTILPHSEENGVIRFEVDKIAPFILFIPDWESAVYIPEEPEPAEVPEVPEEIAAPTEDTGTQQVTEPADQPAELTPVPEETAEPVSEVPVESAADTQAADIQNQEPASAEEPVEEVYAQTVTASGTDYSVSLTYTADANIPEGSMFELSELPASGILYDNLTTSVASTLNAEAEEISSVTFVDVDVKKDGDSVPLDAPVSVSIAVDDPADGDTVTQVVALGQQNEVLNTEEGTTGTFSSTTENLDSTYAIVRITKQATLKTSDDQTWLITVTYDRDDPAIPADVELVVNELKEGDPGYDEYLAAGAAVTGADRNNLAFAKAFDICLIDPATGVECQPTKEVSVSVQLLEEEVDEKTQIDVVHFSEPDSPEQIDCALNEESKAIEFAAPGFSVYLIMGYTVDFHWGDYTYSIAGESEITLSALFEKLGVTEITLADVTDLSFSTPEYIAIERLDSDWLLRSLAPFSTVEFLTLNLKNGQNCVIRVTDVSDYGTVIGSGTDSNVTWTEYQDGTEYILVISVPESQSGVVPNSVRTAVNNSGVALSNQVTKIILEEGITGFEGNDTFNGYKKLITFIPCSTLTSIPQSTFRKSSLQFFDFSKATGLVSLGKQAFSPSNLTSIDLSGLASLTSIGDSVWQAQYNNESSYNGTPKAEELNFSGCTSLSSIGNTAFNGIASNIHVLNISETPLTALTKFETLTKLTTLIAQNCSELTEPNVQSFSNLTSLNLSNSSVTTIQNLSECTNLQTLDISGCTSLTTLTVPNSVTTLNVSGIGLTALDLSACTNLSILDVSGCTNLTSLTVPSSVTTLNVSGTGLTALDLSACTNLSTLDVSNCTGLTELTVPSSVTSLNVSGSGLTTLDISGCENLDPLDLSTCASLASVKVGNRSDLTDLSWLTLPDSVTTLDASGFTSLTSIEVPNSVTSLNLSGCTGLTALDLSDTSLSNIDVSENSSLMALKLPASVTTLNVNNSSNLVIFFDGTSASLPDDLGVSVFCWGDYTYTIERDATVTLGEIFPACEITAINSTDVQSISASDPSILQVSGLTVKNLKAFTTPQMLAIELNNGLSGAVTVLCAPLEESNNLNEFLDAETVFAYEGEADTHPLSDAAILEQDDKLNLTLSFSEIPEGQEGERQMALLSPMTYTFPANLTISNIPATVTLNLQGRETVVAAVTQGTDSETGATILTVTADPGEQAAAISASDEVSFTIPVTVQVNTVPYDYYLGNDLILSAVKSHNVKVSSFTADYDAEEGTVTYTAVVEAESDLDFDGNKYSVVITDLTTGDSPALQFVSGSYTYEQADVPSEAATFSGFPLTVEHMHEGDIVTLTYQAKVLKGEYTGSGEAQIQNTVTISNSGNPSDSPEDNTASVTTTVPYTPLTREYVTLDGSWAYWRVTVNPGGYTLGDGRNLKLLDTFDDGEELDARQSIDYASIQVVSTGIVTYDYSGSTGTFVIPDETAVTITYRTRITAQPGESVSFRGTAVLRDADGNQIDTSTAGVMEGEEEEEVVIYPSPSDVTGSDYMVKLYVYADGQMQRGIKGAIFILLDANQRPLEYKLGENKGQPVTFTTGSDGYVNIELNEESGDISIEKNTGYYLEMMQAVPGYQKDNTLYSFMITDDPSYSSGGFYKYYNGDTMKVRLYPATAGLSVSIRFSGSYALREDQQNNVTAILQKLEGENNWVEVERHPYSDTQWGSIKFNEVLYDPNSAYQNVYRVVEENQLPWDLPDEIVLTTTYYCLVNSETEDPHEEPQEFVAGNADDAVSVVIDNRYEEPQLTLIKMDKQTGDTLSGAKYSVYEIVNGEATGDAIIEYETKAEEGNEVVIHGGEPFESEILYGIKETQPPEDYLLPQKDEWHYFYFCNDKYLEPSIKANLPAGATAINLTNNGDRITVDNQKKEITIPVMKIWQGGTWPDGVDAVVGLYQAVGEDDPKPVKVDAEGHVMSYNDDREGTPLTVTLASSMPYNNTTFTGLTSRYRDQNITYSIKEESISGQNPLEAGYNQEYGISSAGIYIVRNKPATTLKIDKEWFDFQGNKVEDESVIAAQSPVTFDVYRSSSKFVDENPDDGITNADMTAFVSDPKNRVVKEREKLSFGADEGWTMSIPDLDRQDDQGYLYYYYVIENVPSFGNELYELNEAGGIVKIKNKIAPETVNLTVTKAKLEDDPRPESLERDFEFTLKLQVDDTHPVRNWQVYTDDNNPENNLVTDWNGEAVFTLKPTNPATQPTEGASITLTLPVGVTAAVTEMYNPEYTVETNATVGGTTGDDDRTFSYVTTASVNPTVTYTNTLHVICKVVTDTGTTIPFESIKSALARLRSPQEGERFNSPWTIYMLEDYTIPVTDVVEVQEGENLTITTASMTDELFPFKPGEETERAVITRGGAGDSMLKNAGTLTLANICLDGGNITAAGDGGLVNSTGTLNLNDKTTLRNSVTTGKGGAVYAEGTVNIASGVAVTGNSAPSASALYLNGTLNMTGGSITNNTGAADGAVVAVDTGDEINLSGSPVIFGNTNKLDDDGKAANLFIGVDSDNVVNVIAPGLTESARIGVTAMEGHMLIGEQFASAAFEQTSNLNRFINDEYGYRGKLKDGTSTNIVWDGLKITIKKVVETIGANPNDRFTITLASPSIIMSTYIIDGTLDYTVTAARQGRPGTIVLRNVKADDVISISPLPVGTYTISEDAPNYSQTYTINETGSGGTPKEIEDGTFSADNDSTVFVTNTRKLAEVNLIKTLEDRLEIDAVDFGFTVQLIDADGTAVSGFPLKTDEEGMPIPGFTTNEDGKVTFTMSPTDAIDATESFQAPVGATMTITETVNPNYRITASAKTMPSEGEGAEIKDQDTANANVFAFPVTDDGAAVTFANERKMANIELSKTLVGKVSKTENYEFTVTLTRADGNHAVGYTMYVDAEDPANNITTDEDGKATIPFDFGEDESVKSVTLTIPEGTKLEVVETNANGNFDWYDTTYSRNGAAAISGTAVIINPVSDIDRSIAFTNTRKTRTITVPNTVSGYSGNVVPFTYTATVTDGGENDYNDNGFTDGVQTFELATGQNKILIVPYGAQLTVAESFIVGYKTTIKHGNTNVEFSTDRDPEDKFNVTENVTVAFSHDQLIGLRLVNNTSSVLSNVNVVVGYGTEIYRVNEDKTGQNKINEGSNKNVTLSIDPGKTAILEITHQTSPTAEQTYTVSGNMPTAGYYYTINNEPSFHEFADPAILRVYDQAQYTVKGRLRYSVSDSTVTFTEQPLVSFNLNGGAWTKEMEDYHWDNTNGVYQMAVTKGGNVARPAPDPVYPTAENIPLLGWTTDKGFAEESHTVDEDISAKAYNFDTPVTAPVTLYAVWAKPARETRVVTVRNGFADSLTVTATLTRNGTAVSGHNMAENLTTDASGQVNFTLSAGESVNLTVPNGAKLVLSLDTPAFGVSGQFVDSDSDDNSFTIDHVTRDGTVTFTPGVCKITDAGGNILYDGNGNPAVYSTLEAAFTAYNGTLYTTAEHTTSATPAAVKMLVDEYAITKVHEFPKNNVILTTADKNDNDFPYAGTQDRSTLYRDANFKNESCFKAEGNTGREVTLTNIIMDGHNVPINDTINGNIIRVVQKNSVLTIKTGTIFRNTAMTAYTNNGGGYGGAVYLRNGKVNVYAGLFSNCHARLGGAICVNDNVNDGTVNLKVSGSVRFEDCIAETSNGGAIYYYSKGTDLTINGGEDKNNPDIVFERCVAKSNNSEGGAIYANTNSNYSVTVKGCEFVECSSRMTGGGDATGNGGGAINAYKVKSVNVSHCTFTACDTLRCGGAVAGYVATSYDLNKAIYISDCDFESCNCGGQGGAVGAYQVTSNANSRTEFFVVNCNFNSCSSGTKNGSGGAIQSYVPCMHFENSNFTDCWAGKEGGAFNNWYGSDNAVWPNSYMNVINCQFINCRAEDRYQLENRVHYGGAIATKAETLVIDGSTFTDCVSTLREGGAVHCSGYGDNSKATVTNTTFKNCQAKTNGGALMASSKTMTVEYCKFYGCSSFAENGGAIYHGQSVNDLKSGSTTTVKSCTFSADPEKQNSASCSATQNGGAIWTKATNVRVEGCTIDGCIANGNGGGVYQSNGSSSATYTNGSITGCQAVSGSAVYLEDKAAATFSGITISDNTVSDINSAALVGGDGSKMYFEGNVIVGEVTGKDEVTGEDIVIVKGNKCSADKLYDHDVLMHRNNNSDSNMTVIQTTRTGLSENAHVGVYVPDNVFDRRGTEGKVFGTHGSGNGSAYLENFFNDRNDELFGYDGGSDSYIYWGTYLCKITDAEGRTLKRANGTTDAAYQKLTMALDEFTTVTGGNPVYIKMLVENYNIQQDAQISNFPAADVTLTTAGTNEPDGKHPYRGTPGTVCTISRTNSYNQLFYLNNANATFQLENITLDGRRDKTSEVGNFRLIQADSGNLVINPGTTLQYGSFTGDKQVGGGAIYTKGLLTIHGDYDAVNQTASVKFTNCINRKDGTFASTDANGGAIYADRLVIDFHGENADGKHYGTAFINCASARGGAVCISGKQADVSGAKFEDCYCKYEGGAFYHNNNDKASTSHCRIEASAFENCYTETDEHWSYGGAVNAKIGTLILDTCSFKNCYARSDGGAINHGVDQVDRVKTEIINTVFDNCRTTGNNNYYGVGGCVYTRAMTVDVQGSTFKNTVAYNHGGALYCENSNNAASTTISGATFENCSVKRASGYGGAIYSRNKTLTIQDQGTEATTINACTVPGYSGAIYLEKDNSVLNITGNTKITGCYANQGGAIYLKNTVTLNLNGSPEFSSNGFMTQNGTIVNAEKGACIYLSEGSLINLKGSPKFSRNILPNETRIANGGVTDYVRQDIFMAGYTGNEASSINVVGELTGDTIWVWPEQSPHRLANEQFAKIDEGVSVSEDTLNHFRNALADNDTHCTNGEYLAGVQLNKTNKNVYWDKMYTVSFKKIDNKGVTVPDAEFTLYKDLACTQFVAKAVSADGETDTDAQGKLLARGTVEFTAIRIGAYYMKETKVPDSFKENDTKYLVLVGTPYLSPNDDNRYLWEDDGPLNVKDAATLVARYTTDAGKYYGIFPLDENNKAILRANLASNSVGIENVRNDYQAWFMKLDESGNALPGAAFTIYTQMLDSEGQPDTFDDDGYPKLMLWTRDGETYPAPVESADGTNKYKDIDNKNLAKGLVYFRDLPLGTYYLLETGYPERNGSNRRTFYQETERVLKLVIWLDADQKPVFTVQELKFDTETKKYGEYETLPTNTSGYFYISNTDVVCKLTDQNNNLLQVQGHELWENKTESSVRLLPAIYTTLEDGFAAAQTGTFVYDNGNAAHVNSVKLKVLKDFDLTEAVVYNNNTREITFTTAETVVLKDKYIFSTNRTSDTSRAHINRAYSADISADENDGALITLAGTTDMTLQNICLIGRNASYNGRAMHVKDSSSLTILNNTQIENFSQTASTDSTDTNNVQGGAILLEEGASITINGGFNKTAVFSENESNDGGAIAFDSSCTVEIRNAQFNSNTAGARGGAVYVPAGGNASFTDVVMKGNSAAYGGAFYVDSITENADGNTDGSTEGGTDGSTDGSTEGNTDGNTQTVSAGTLTISGGSITGNTARGEDGGAINVGDENARIYFGGSPVVFDNTVGNQQKNVVLSEDSYNVICTTENGITGGLVGVYVTGDLAGDQFTKHGLPGKPFGTFGDSARENPNVFRNDRALNLTGTWSTETDSTKEEYNTIYWNDVLCKLTDSKDVLLYKDETISVNGRNMTLKVPAVYTSIQDGFNAAEGTLYVKNTESGKYDLFDRSGTGELKLKMLKDAVLEEGILYKGKRGVVFTTAETVLTEDMIIAGDYFWFMTTRTDTSDHPETTALITRAFADAPMITVEGKKLTLTDITLDGNSIPVDKVDGGIVSVLKNSLTVTTGAELRNSVTTGNGGAVYASRDGAVTVSGGTIVDNTAASGAGIYMTAGSTLNISGNPNFGGTGVNTDGSINENVGNHSTTSLKAGSKNGDKEFTKARQDIYLDGTGNPLMSLVINGELKDPADNTKGMPAGSIWVWAGSGKKEGTNHYVMLKQFAVIADGVTVSESTYTAFRDARPDEDTDCGGDYLTGQSGDKINNMNCVYWRGGYDFSFLKVDGFGNPLDGATFTLYTSYTSPDTNTPYQKGGKDVMATSSNGKDITLFPDPEDSTKAQPKGTVLFTKIAPKTYYMVETGTPEGYVPNTDTKSTIYRLTMQNNGTAKLERKLLSEADSAYKDAFYVEIQAATEATATEPAHPAINQYQVMNISEAERPVILKKINERMVPLEGGKFNILRYDRTVVAEGLESDATGIYFIGRLPYGTYIVEETDPPSGYRNPGNNRFVFSVDENGVHNGGKTGTVINILRPTWNKNYSVLPTTP